MTGLRLSHGLDAQVASLLAKSATLLTALDIKPVACHAAVRQVSECNQELAVKSLPYLQH